MNNMTAPLTRRNFLQLGGLAGMGLSLSACGVTQAAATTSPAPVAGQRVLRIAHLTDFHVMPEGFAPQGVAKAFRHAQSQPDKPDIIINTGDSIMDSLEANKERTEAQWEVFNNIVQAECKLPIYHAIGNHDVWGWGRQASDIQADPLYGKGMALKMLDLPERYYSFERAGWHFIVLDSTHEPNRVSEYPYIGQLDDEQFGWLEKEVESVDSQTHICILSHIPILCACEYLDGENEASGNWVVPAAWMHIDARRFRQLFLKHPNIRVCLSGHSHQAETLEYMSVRYLNDGAVCGNWWMGAYMDFPPAYVLVDLYADGRAESTFVPYS
jgi:Icc protein